jgi:hypothetical protein
MPSGTALRAQTVSLQDGRTVIVREYGDDSIRIQVKGGNFVFAMTECWLSGKGKDAIIKLEQLEA